MSTIDLEIIKKNHSLQVDKNLLDLLNQDSDLLKNSNNKKDNLELSKRIKINCSKIFNNLRNQTNDSLLIIFLDELLNKILNYINNEVNYFNSLDNINNNKNNPLKKEGYYFGNLNEKIVNEILDIAEDDIKNFRKNVLKNKTSRIDLSANTGKNIKKNY